MKRTGYRNFPFRDEYARAYTERNTHDLNPWEWKREVVEREILLLFQNSFTFFTLPNLQVFLLFIFIIILFFFFFNNFIKLVEKSKNWLSISYRVMKMKMCEYFVMNEILPVIHWSSSFHVAMLRQHTVGNPISLSTNEEKFHSNRLLRTFPQLMKNLTRSMILQTLVEMSTTRGRFFLRPVCFSTGNDKNNLDKTANTWITRVQDGGRLAKSPIDLWTVINASRPGVMYKLAPAQSSRASIVISSFCRMI